MAQLKDLIVNGPARIIGDLQGSNISASNIIATTFNGYLSGTAENAVTAQYATFDEDGNEIATQYVHSISVTSNASTMTITLSNTKNSQISSVTLPINTTATAGIVPVNSTTGLKVWGTDYSGNPGWRESIPFIIGTGTTAGKWLGTLDNLTEYYDGLLILYKPSVAGASTTTLKLNDLEAKTVYINSTTKLTTHFPAHQPILLVYSASQNSGGCWMALDNYWTNSDTKLRTYRFNVDNQNAEQDADLPLAALSGTSTASVTNPSFNFANTSSYLDVYGVRSSNSSIQALYNPYSGLVTVQDLTVRNSISANNITAQLASTTENGLMSFDDKIKIDNLYQTIDGFVLDKNKIEVNFNTTDNLIHYKKNYNEAGWNTELHSSYNYYGGCILSFNSDQANIAMAIGLTTSAVPCSTTANLDFYWYLNSAGTASIYEKGLKVNDVTAISYQASDNFRIEFSNSYIKYFYNGQLKRIIEKSMSNFHMVYMPYGNNASISNLKFEAIQNSTINSLYTPLGDGTGMLTFGSY